MKVLYCVDSFGTGGTELNALRTAGHLLERGVDLAVACLNDHGPIRQMYQDLGVKILPLERKGSGAWNYLNWSKELIRLAREEQAHVLHAHDLYSNLTGALARARGLPCSLVVSQRWQTVLSVPWRWASRFSYRRADGILVNTDGLIPYARELGRIDGSKITVIRNFLEDDQFDPGRPTLSAELPDPLRHGGESLVFGMLARLSRVKRHDLALEAFGAVVQRLPGACLVLFGDGPERARLEAIVAEKGLEGLVIFAGEVPNVPSPFNWVDVALSSSDREGFPNSLLEALAVKVPVVSTDVGGVSDCIRDGSTGLLVPPGDPRALSEAMLRLGADAGLGMALGSAGHELVRRNYSADAAISALLQFYERIR